MAASNMGVLETLTPLDVSKMCRVCMRTDRPLCQIFDESNEQSDLGGHNNLAELLMQCSRLPLKRNDELPQQICEECKSTALIACRFHSECMSTHQKLVTLLGGGNQATCAVDTHNTADTMKKDETTQTECGTSIGYGQHVAKKTTKTISKGSGGGQVRTIMKCPICKRQFTRSDYLRSHLAVVHKIIETSHDNENSAVEVNVLEEQELPILEVATLVPQYEMEFVINAPEIEKNNMDCDPTTFKFDDLQTKHEEINSHDKSEKLSFEEDEQPLSLLLRHDSLSSLILEVINIGERADEETRASLQQMADPQTNSTEKMSNVSKRQSPPMTSMLKDSDKKIGIENDMQVEQTIVLEVENSDSKETFDSFNFMEDEEQLSLLLSNDESSNSLLIEFINVNTEETKEKVDGLQLTELIKNTEQMSDKQMNNDSKPKREPRTKKDKSKSAGEATEVKKSHKCHICSKSFTTRFYLLRHIGTHEHKRYVCKECSQSYITKEELKAHIKELAHDKPMLCPECGLRCKTRNILSVHMGRHKGVKPYNCKFCNKGFARADDVRVHERYHTNEKLHFCTVCGKGFQRKYNLTIHMRVHTGERPYKCSHCPQAFAQSNDLKAHIRRHTGERFICDQCGAAFLQSYQLRHHRSAEHGIVEQSYTQRVKKFTSLESQEEQIELTKALNNAKTALPSTEATTVTSLVIVTNISEEVLSLPLTIDNNSSNTSQWAKSS